MSELYGDAVYDSELIIGWRAWRAGMVTAEDGRLLRSVTKGDVDWAFRDLIGECRLGSRRVKAAARCTEHLISMKPGWSRKCSCGIHTLKTPRDLPAYALARPTIRRAGRPTGFDAPYTVVGAVAVFGTVVETTLGYLSDRARIEALFLCPPSYPNESRCPTCPPCHCPGEFTDVMHEDAERYARQFGVPVKLINMGELLDQIGV